MSTVQSVRVLVVFFKRVWVGRGLPIDILFILKIQSGIYFQCFFYINLQIVQQNLERSMKRMGVSRLDCLQFHWWVYSDPRYIDALKHMAEMQKEGKIGNKTFPFSLTKASLILSIW